MPVPAGSGSSGGPLVPSGLGGWAVAIAGVVRRSGRPLAVLQVACAVPAVLLGLLFGRVGPVATALVVGVATAGLGALAQAGSVYLAVREAAGRPTAVSAALRFGAGRLLALLGWGAVAAVLVAVGLALAVLPGLYFAVVFGAALPGVVTVERAGLRRCVALVNRRLLPTAVRCAAALFGAALYGACAGTALALVPGGPAGVAGALARFVLALPVTITAAAFAAVTYAELRWHCDGAGTDRLAAEIGL